jgi:protein-disulfide isomerase
MTSDSKFFVGILIAAAMVIGALFTLTSVKKPSSTDVETGSGHKTGPDSAPVKIVEFSDYQCPACATVPAVMDKVLEANPDKVQYIVRNFPLSQHAHSQEAAQAAEAAATQGKFWEMHKLIFENQGSWENESNVYSIFLGYAKQLKLDESKFNQDYNSASTKQKITDDYDYGISLEITSTPTFFVNGVAYAGNRSVQDWQKIIDDAVTE